jgi:hypothetical protein
MFRARDLEHGWAVFAAQFDHWQTVSTAALGWQVMTVLAVAIVGHLLTHRFYDRCAGVFAQLPVVVRVLVLVAAALGIQHIASAEAQPFIYFKF